MTAQSIPRTLSVYALGGLLCTTALAAHLRLWRADLDIPMEYTTQGDAFFNDMVVKTLLEQGWVHNNPALGAPGAMQLYDFPMTNDLNLLLIKALGLVGAGAFRVVNLFYLATFLLTTWTALFAFRRCGVSDPLAVGGALAFSFLPYHFYRGQSHLFLSAYHAVPMVALAAFWVAEGRPLFFARDERGGLRLRLGAEAAIALSAVVLLGGSDVYYAYFGAFLVVVAGLMAGLRFRSRAGVLDAIALLVMICVLVFASVVPSLVHGWRSGFNPAPTDFGYIEADIYGLRIANLLKPGPGHRIYALIQPGYTERPGNENRYSYLGIPGALGFLALLVALLANRPPAVRLEPLGSLSRLNIAVVLLGTKGGFGLLFAGMVSAQIRAYNRISVVIAFYSILAVLLLLEALLERMSGAWPRRAARAVLAALLAVSGMIADVPLTVRPDHDALAAAFLHDRAFIRQIEAALPAGAMVFQLPYLTMPEAPEKPYRMEAYGHLRGYLHSRRLRWSYGAIRGREAARWQQQVASEPAEVLVRTLTGAGFRGLYIDRYGYGDGAAGLEGQLRSILGRPPLQSGNGRFVFFILRPARAGPA